MNGYLIAAYTVTVLGLAFYALLLRGERQRLLRGRE